MSRQFARVAVVTSFVIASVLSSTVASAQGLTVAVGTPNLSIDRVSIIVPVAVSCAPFDSSLTHFASDVRVMVQQASGRQIARGTGSISAFSPNVLFPCDGGEYR